MDGTMKNTCSFCLKTANEFDICKFTKEMLDELLLLNLDISNETLICNECSTTLQDVIVFKSNFIKSEENENFASKDEYGPIGLNSASEECNTCRFCKAQSKCYTDLREKEEYIIIVDTIEKYIPQLECSEAENIRTCANCLDILQSFVNFMINYSSMKATLKKETVETDIKDYLKWNGVQNFIFKNEINFDNVKIENIEDNEEVLINEIKCENFKEDDLELQGKRLDNEMASDRNVSGRCLNSEKAELLRRYLISNEAKSKLACQLTHVSVEKCVNDKLVYFCDMCNYRTECEVNLSTHKERHKAKDEVKTARLSHDEFKCQKCSFETNKKQDLQQHMHKHLEPDDPNIVVCYICGYKTKWKSSLIRHTKTHVPRPQQPITEKCHLCPYQPKSVSKLRRHLLTTHKSSQYRCDQCSYVTNVKKLLKSHLNRHLTDDNPNLALFTCDECNFKSKWRSSRDKHLKRWHKAVECDM